MAIAKDEIKRELTARLSDEKEVRRIVIFGSFLTNPNPHDLDVAVFQDSNDGYLSLALKYRKITRSIADKIPLDIIPMKVNRSDGAFMAEIAKGEVIFER